MGGAESKEEADPPKEMTEEMQQALDENTYYPGESARYPYFLIQLSEKGELPYGDDEIYVSDCISAYVANNDVTHIMVQTHGWNTPPDKAVAVPFTEFMGGMQNDAAMPAEDDESFKPIWVAFIWPAVPYDFFQETDALTRTELLIQNEDENHEEESDIKQAAEAAKHAIENEDVDDEEFNNQVKVLAEHTIDESEDDDDDDGDPEAKVGRAKETPLSEITEGVIDIFSPVLRPLENLVFGRLMKRGRKCGRHMGLCIAKIMHAANQKEDVEDDALKTPKVCMMANSLGAHMLIGVISVSEEAMPYRIHAVFFVQGAISKEYFGLNRRYSEYAEKIAGPCVATYSENDFLLKGMFSTFHGDALGFDGFGTGNIIDMKACGDVEESPYEFETRSFNSVNGSEFINEGNAFAGGHSDFKDDETTTLYWTMIKTELDPEAYEF